ncbi:MAG: SDR family oxidoreductase, partial [Cyclonatronaceae bacterium]
KSLAKELASRNIRVNTIAPGYIKTEMTGQLSDKMMETISASIPMATPGEVDDIAAGVIYLASDASRYVTGESLRIDGGMAM